MPGWRDSALCSIVISVAKADDLFYGTRDRDIRAAKRLCDECPVKVECLDDAMRMEGAAGSGGRFGVRGGLTGEERARLRVKRQRAKWR